MILSTEASVEDSEGSAAVSEVLILTSDDTETSGSLTLQEVTIAKTAAEATKKEQILRQQLILISSSYNHKYCAVIIQH